VEKVSPPLTIGMPVYNGEPYVAAAIESILAQTYGEFVLVVSDNASTDNTEEICRHYASADRRVIYSKLVANLGAAPNFNRVFSMNRSPYFKFAAADDVCAPRFLEVCMNAYRDAPQDVVLCFPRTIRIDATSSHEGVIQENMDLRQSTPPARFRAFLQQYWLANCFYGVLRSDCYASTRLHKSYDSADIVLLAELALRGKFWQLNEPLFMRRFHEGMSHKANPSSAQIRNWYDTSKRGGVSLPRVRMCWEFVRAIDSAPLSVADRMRCRRELASVWLANNWKTMAREIAVSVRGSISRRS
jgi:glycosyltransferase involved in cell wall biosynthesis